MRTKSAHNWIWKWHLIGGVFCLPFILLLSITGIIYLFKDTYEAEDLRALRQVQKGEQRLSYDEQYRIASEKWEKPINSILLPTGENEAIAFVSGRFGAKSTWYLDPYTGKAKGVWSATSSDMYQVRKLHGELLAGKPGTLLIELVGSWLVVLIITGIYLFLPLRRKDLIKLVRIRFAAPRAVFFRDLHMVSGFWFSVVLLLILAGGLPWTDVWGGGFKWVQDQTRTGFPMEWSGRGIQSTPSDTPLSLDEVITLAESYQLPGEVAISIPKGPTGVYSIHNTHYANLSDQVAIHLDQYTGQELDRLQWSDVGMLMRARMWAMAFHQGQFGSWNWTLVLITALFLVIISSSGLLAFAFRHKRNNYGIPERHSYQVKPTYLISLAALCMLLPMFGASVVCIALGEFIRHRKRKLQLQAT
ncbi:PepSY-associated TM helix domain-containing protein [Marinoscillum furvescens]|uniref:Putative iron-regulated membrane protein n=1 Tax=Marinoscillum furvescens DSM 4134 TaxID=1122208 RepID=A0A3D9L2G8_MARFU|nr:PepSY domain-containing protein [Marinoscillum furvescens]RED98429.1 putative iron-regulated membrane protein [Marinoscillum furvescens DSM 4134]